MTKAAIMDPTERIYEEILTRKLGRRDRKQLDRSLSCPGSRKTSHDMGKHSSMSHLRGTDDSEDNLYAVVNGEDIELKKFKDLIDDGSANMNLYHNDKQIGGGTGIAQKSKTRCEGDLIESEKDCDCANTGRELKKSSRPIRPNTLGIKDSETVYSEILHQTPGSQVDLFPERLTRESENPLLRQDVIPSNTPSPSTSIAPSRAGSLRRNDESTRSSSGDSGIQVDMHALSVYENCSGRVRRLHRSQSSPQVYANAASLKNATGGVYANMECNEPRSEAFAGGNSVYANVEDDTKDSRPRASSRPIAIQSNHRNVEVELIYSDLDFEEVPMPEYCSSSTGDASSTSSGMSSFTAHLTNSVSPPPLPSRPPSVSVRRRQTSFSSISMASSVSTSMMRANFIGTHAVHRTTKDSINSSVKETVHKTNMLDVKSVYVDVSKTCVKFCSLSSPYQCVLQFSVDEMHLVDTYSKDERFLGFIVSQPGKEAMCHVFQSDHSAEIIAAVKEVFKESSMRQRFSSPDRPKSYYGELQSENQCSYPGIIKIGSLKVKNSLLVINDSIATLLEKVNPKEYSRVDLKIKDSSTLVVTSESRLKAEEHAIAWILSLGLYNNDGRYFGYIVSKTKGGKTRMYCHVYKCSTVMMSATILEAIRSACQNALAPGRAPVPRCSSSMPRSGFRSRLMTSPDAVSRSSTSSDETVREANSPRVTRSRDFGHLTSNCVRELSYENDESEQANITEPIGLIDEQPKGEDINDEEISRGTADLMDKPDNLSTGSQNNNVLEQKGDETDIMESSEGTDGLQESDSPSSLSEALRINTEKVDHIIDRSFSDHVEESQSNLSVGDVMLQGADKVQKPEHQNEAKENHKDKKSPSSKRRSKIFRGSLIRKKKDSASKLSASMQSLDFIPREEEEVAAPPVKKEYNFVISYLCSAVVKPPFKGKHVEKCLKQYQKEVGKKQKVGDVCSLGNKLMLQVITDEGVTMLDIRNPDSFRRHFPISTIDSFIVHPENPDCFAFSTTVPGDEQHKYHLFYKSRDNIATVKEAFEQLKQFQKIF